MLTQLGTKSEIADNPDSAVIETFDNSNPKDPYCVRFICPEFTSRCPITGQPDFAKFIIDYVPCQKMIESKSLKLFLTSFRNHGAFHEDCTTYIANRLFESIGYHHWLRISGFWYTRGGISINVFYELGTLPHPKMYIPKVNEKQL